MDLTLNYRTREETQRWIGHADGSTVTDRVYNHYEHQMDISKLERFEEALRKKKKYNIGVCVNILSIFEEQMVILGDVLYFP